MRRMSSLLLLALLACSHAAPKRAAPAAPAIPEHPIVKDVRDGDVRDVVLSNGLRVLLKENHAAPVATFTVYYKVGSRNEHVGNTGSSHLLEHLQFKGSAAFPGREGIWGGLTRIGASFNATTFYDRTNYYETVPVDQLPFGIALEADRMRHSTFTDADRASEMPVVRNELERGENNPGQMLNQLLWAAAMIAHPYHHPVIGWRSDVENVPTSMLRAHYDTYYQPDNAVVACVGDFDSEAVLREIVSKFSAIPGGHTFPPVYTVEETQRGERRFVIRKPGALPLIQMGWRLPAAAHPDVVPLKVLQLVLAGTLELNEFGDPLDPGISNRLHQALVETELATSAGFSYTLMIDPSLASISARIRPGVEHAKVERAIAAQIARLRDEPVSSAELDRAKARARAAFGLSQDGTFGQAMALGYFGLIGDWHFVRDFSGRVDAVSADDLQRVARTWFSDDAATVGWFVPTATANVSEAGAKPSGAAKLREADDRAEADVVAARARGALPPLRRKTLANGLKVVVQENPATATFALSGSILAGSVHETPSELALAGVTAEMLERGTRRHTKLALADRLEAVGASFGFGDGFESVGLSGLALSADLERLVDVMAEELTEPAFAPDELAKVVGERMARVRQAEDSTGVRGRRALMQALYPKGHPLHTDDPEVVLAALHGMTPERLRSWFSRFYGPDRTVLTFVGNVRADDVFALVEKRLGSWKPVGGPAVSSLVPPPTAAARIHVPFADKSNVDVFLGAANDVKRTDADYYAAMLANHVLGGGSSGRLFARIRNEMGLTYGINSALSAGKVAGPWSVSMTVNPRAVDAALSAVSDVLHRWHAEGPSEKELSDAKRALTGLYKVGLATNAGLAGTMTQYETLGLGAEFVAEHPKRIEAVTIAQVREAIARHYFPERLVTVTSGTLPRAAAEAPPTKAE